MIRLESLLACNVFGKILHKNLSVFFWSPLFFLWLVITTNKFNSCAYIRTSSRFYRNFPTYDMIILLCC